MEDTRINLCGHRLEGPPPLAAQYKRVAPAAGPRTIPGHESDPGLETCNVESVWGGIPDKAGDVCFMSSEREGRSWDRSGERASMRDGPTTRSVMRG